MSMTVEHRYKQVVQQIADLGWSVLSRDDLSCVQWAYYYFSVQFRESLEIACRLFDTDERLARLKREECDTANLSPFPGIALPGERMNHDNCANAASEVAAATNHHAISSVPADSAMPVARFMIDSTEVICGL